MDSILDTVKRSVGIDESCVDFDDTLIMHINSVFMSLRQIGVGPEQGYKIDNKGDIWSEFITTDDILYEGVRTYVSAKVRLMFDPPTSSGLLKALEDTVSEFEWRVHWEAELKL